MAHSKELRAPLAAIVSMLGLVELGHKLTSVRPLSEKPSDFDEKAFQHIRRNFGKLLEYFDELADLAGEPRLHVQEGASPAETTAISTFINAAVGKA